MQEQLLQGRKQGGFTKAARPYQNMRLLIDSQTVYKLGLIHVHAALGAQIRKGRICSRKFSMQLIKI